MLSVWDAHSTFARTHHAGQETTRAIRAVQMSAGDKDRTSLHRIGGSLTQARSRDSTQEHEHCAANMLADLAESSACDILGRESNDRQADPSRKKDRVFCLIYVSQAV